MQTFSQIKETTTVWFSGSSLKTAIFRGGLWLGTGAVAEQLIRFGRNMVLARLLAPADFGLMAIVSSATSVIHTMMDIGVREALIQNRRGGDKEYVDAAWWMAFGRGIGFWIILSLVSPLFSKFYGHADLGLLFRVCALGLVFDGAVSMKAVVAVKEMRFSRYAAMNHGGAICGVAITVLLSFMLQDVWALVIGSVAESAVRCILSFIFFPYLPPLGWSTSAVRVLLKFSRGILGLSLLNLIFARTDIFVLGKLLNASQLGLYSMAVYLVQTPTNFVMNIFGQTILPTFSRIHEDKTRLNRAFLKVSSLIFLAGFPAVIVALFCGRSLLGVAYGSRYASGGSVLAITAIVSVINLANAQITSVFYACGLPHLHRTCVLIMAVTMVILVYPLVSFFGLSGGQLACLSAILVGFSFQLIRLRRITGLDLRDYMQRLATAAGVSVITAAICASSLILPVSTKPSFNLATGFVACLAAYTVVALGFIRNKQNTVA
jgi:O-antigen/teichoic acid export membrane protein